MALGARLQTPPISLPSNHHPCRYAVLSHEVGLTSYSLEELLAMLRYHRLLPAAARAAAAQDSQGFFRQRRADRLLLHSGAAAATRELQPSLAPHVTSDRCNEDSECIRDPSHGGSFMRTRRGRVMPRLLYKLQLIKRVLKFGPAVRLCLAATLCYSI